MNHDDVASTLSGLPPAEKILFAAKIIEGAAFELAGEVDANRVSSLILMAAQLERIANNEDVRNIGKDGKADALTG